MTSAAEHPHPPRPKPRATLVAILGIDGSGKSTQVAELTAWINAQGVPASAHKVERNRAKLNRSARKAGAADLVDLAGPELAAFASAIVGWRSLRALRDPLRRPGAFVVVDRFAHCHYVSTAIDHPPLVPTVRALLGTFRMPDVTYFLDIRPERAYERLLARRGFDTEDLPTLSTLDRGYRALPEASGFVFVDADGDADDVQRRIRADLLLKYPGLLNGDEPPRR